MTKRFEYPASWASSGQAVDPDLDTTHPSYEANRYAQKGWHSEKPPEEWQNFLSQITDDKVINLIVDGVQQWDSGVTYQAGALAKVSGVTYIRVTVVTPVKSPEVSGSGWDVLIDPTASGFNNLVSSLLLKLTGHTEAFNPHEDDIHDVIGGGYLKTEVDPKFNSPTDPKTIINHMAKTGQSVHGETPAQVGTLPVAGGTFTGPVIFENDAIIQVSPSKIVHLNKATALLEMASGTVSLGIAANGVGYIVTSTGTYVVMTEANYAQLNINVGFDFALPIPIMSFTTKYSLGDYDDFGRWQLRWANAQVFDAKGWQMAVDVVFDKGVPATGANTVLAFGTTLDGTKVRLLQDFASWNMPEGYKLMDLIRSAFGDTTMIYLQSIVIYPRLNDNQKTMLPR